MGVNGLQPPPAVPPDKENGTHYATIPPTGHATAEPTHRPQLYRGNKKNSSSAVSIMAHKKIKILVQLTVMFYGFPVEMAMKFLLLH
jgi:hypothetical protein